MFKLCESILKLQSEPRSAAATPELGRAAIRTGAVDKICHIVRPRDVQRQEQQEEDVDQRQRHR